MKIILAHTARSIASMSTRFADNPIAGTAAAVFDGVIDIPTLSGKNGNPGVFALQLKFDRPFAYRRSAGNLLMEVVNTSPVNVPQPLDYASGGSTRTARVVAGNATARSGNKRQNFGLVVRFDIDSGGLAPAISAAGPPNVGSPLRVRLEKGRAFSTALLWLGARRIDVPLPPSLAPGCRLLASLDVLPLATTRTDVTGAAAASVPIPIDFGLLGGRFHTQWAVADVVNPLGFVFSNGAAAVIGL